MFVGGTTERGCIIDAVSTRTGTATMRFPSAKLLQYSLRLATVALLQVLGSSHGEALFSMVLLASYYLVQGLLLIAVGVGALVLVDQNQLLVIKDVWFAWSRRIASFIGS